ncbi:MAG TPA: helix-turn-helix transcriptional regulator [Candidatus Limnocylindrales bacterium]|jgi:transcriptional regulator with XRE-family HTH domain
MEDQRLGAALRAVRIRHGWRQVDVAKRARISPSVVSLIERGQLERVSVRSIRQVSRALETYVSFSLRLTHGELERILNADHAALHEALARQLTQLPGWRHAAEVSFAIYGERGIIDILAFHEPSRSLLVIELKTELVSLEDLLGTMDVRMRHALEIGRSRGWSASSVSAWIVVADSDMNRRRVGQHRTALRVAFPADGRAMRRWLRQPNGPIRALSFWANSTNGTGARSPWARRRVRRSSQARRTV